MTEQQDPRAKQYEQARDAFEDLKIEDRVLFLAQESFATVINGIKAVGDALTHGFNDMFTEAPAEEAPKEEDKTKAAAAPKTAKRKTTARKSTSRTKTTTKSKSTRSTTRKTQPKSSTKSDDDA